MNAFNEELISRLSDLRQQNLFRELRRVDSPQSPHINIDGKPFLNFSSNDYLGLANEPALKDAAIETIRKFGAGAGASRLICGSLGPHHELDETLAAFKGTQAALAFSSGYAAITGVIGALLDSNDVIVLDKLVHASIVDAARLSGAKLRVFGHNNMNDLEKILRWADSRHAAPAIIQTDRKPRTLIVTESIFSMDGDHAPLRDMVELREKHGAWLMVDEAHATGLYGSARRGLAEELGVAQKIQIQMGTLGKALGSSGGYIAGPRSLIEYLINRARPFVFSTAPVPAAAAAATAGVRFVQSAAGAERLNKLWSNVEAFHRAEAEGKAAALERRHKQSAIIPIMIGDEARAVRIAAALREQGIYIPAIRYPTVGHGQARLRVTLSAAHEPEDIARLLTALHPALNLKP
ncbi:MAG: 8-amino-7-oxononanoate synthase [Verrucomicrobiota bacterium]|jgi:8-amino-7-oxononanoate synthase